MWIPRVSLRTLDASARQGAFGGAWPALSATTIRRRRSCAAMPRPLLMVAASTLAGLLIAPRWGNCGGRPALPAGGARRRAASPASGRRCSPPLASALAYNFFFTAPHFTFRIDNPNDVVTVVVLFAVARRDQPARRLGPRAGADRRRPMPRATRPSPASPAGCSPARQRSGDRRRRAPREIGAVCSPATRCWSAGGPSRSCSPPRPRPLRLTPSDIAVAALVLDSGERGRPRRRPRPCRPNGNSIRCAPAAAVIAAIGLARDDGAPPVARRPAAAARQSARPGRAGAGARPARGRGARIRRASANATGCARPCSPRSARISGPG